MLSLAAFPKRSRREIVVAAKTKGLKKNDPLLRLALSTSTVQGAGREQLGKRIIIRWLSGVEAKTVEVKTIEI